MGHHHEEGSRILAERPRHPKSRAVVTREACLASGVISLGLECGHVIRRRYGLCEPSRVICSEC